ncbi:hypothetical protein K1719_045708 [Acacia pycnantha]|nr:hypothetical protein K1719_045708 [Acacia pycnantha]
MVCNSSKPCLLFLSETKSENEGNFACLRALGYDGLAFMPSSGRSGGLIAAWKKVQIDVVVLRKEKQFIHLQCSLPDKETFFLTCVYAIPRPALKHSLWQDLLVLSSSIHRPWVLAGDFNDILSSDERSGGWAPTFPGLTSSIIGYDLVTSRIWDILDLSLLGVGL